MTLSGADRKALVTGGGGFIGSRLVQALLRKGHQVKVLDVQADLLKDMANPNLEFLGIGSSDVRGGMMDKDVVKQAVSDVDVVYHLAINWNGHSWRHMLPLADLFDANIRGTLNLLEAAKSQGVKHFLFSSSCAVYGESESPTLDEESVCKPELWKGDPGPAYGILKLTTEKLCLMYNHHHGLPTTAFRIEVVYDDNETLFLNKDTIDMVAKSETIKVLEGEGIGTVHVDEVVDAFLTATRNKRTYGQVFNLSNPSTYVTYSELYRLIKEATGSKVQINITKDAMQLGSAPEFTEKIQRILGCKPLKTKEDVKEAIKKHVRSILDA
jgi:nucleoside-diphosphate-sugar epimerase